MATQEEKELQAIVAQQQEQIDELQATVNQWRLNGAEDMFGGAGFQRFGGNIMRLDRHGAQVVANDSEEGSIFFVREYSNEPDASPSVTSRERNTVEGLAEPGTRNYVGLSSESLFFGFIHQARVLATSESLGDQSARVHINVVDANGQGDFIIHSTHIYTTYPLRFDTGTSDPTSPEDGMLWYRSDLDEIRVRVNGATRKLDHSAV